MRKFDLDVRTTSGSYTRRLDPNIVQTGLNQRIGGNMPRPLVHCNDKKVPDQQSGRQPRIGLSDRLSRK